MQSGIHEKFPAGPHLLQAAIKISGNNEGGRSSQVIAGHHHSSLDGNTFETMNRIFRWVQ